MMISIHSPLAGRDQATAGAGTNAGIFQSTRPSRGETLQPARHTSAWKFQSTRPSRGETCSGVRCVFCVSYFNPLAPRGARRAGLQTQWQNSGISIHSPLAGRDDFNAREVDGQLVISIHSPLAGRDALVHLAQHQLFDFNPLAPRGARLDSDTNISLCRIISIHSPLAGRDIAFFVILVIFATISIHSPLAGRD